MTRKFRILVAAALLALIAAAYLTLTPSSPVSDAHQASAKEPRSEASARPAASSQNENPTLVATPPSAEIVRSEVARNPHTTPPSLIQFAAAMSAKFSRAVQSPENAKIYLEELERCIDADSPSTVASAQGLCILHMRELVGRFPVLEERAKKILDDSTNERAKYLASLMPTAADHR
jgi:hypothetical protein